MNQSGIGPTFEEVVDVSEQILSENTDVTENGRIDVNLDSRLIRALSFLVPEQLDLGCEEAPPPYEDFRSISIRLKVVIQVVGSRGDVQPFIAVGNELQKNGHRVRIATHNVFESFVRDAGLEFYPIGGDPTELMAYMVRNPGLIPSMKSLRAGEVQQKRKMIAEMLDGCWKSCIEADQKTGAPFVADAIIGNPPSFAHIHCAQALNIPCHLMFTMPWSSTRAFPHPLANLRSLKKSTDPRSTNYLSYMVVEWMTWQGLGDIINDWRKTMDLEAVPTTEGPLLAETLKIPFTYCWSPALVPKPLDWPSHIDVCGFFFREAPNFTPPTDLDHFLRSGPPPIYIGFGSIVIDNPEKMTKTIIEAIRQTGVRAIISRGWSKLGGDSPNEKDIFYLGDCPHEWLFQHVAAVIHHGGAGTTACGLLNAVPTTIIPFFGDQPFWGDMVAAAGAGPSPIPHRSLNPQKLADAISYCLTREARQAAATIAEKMRAENGVKTAVESFHRNLPLERMGCDILQDQPAAWVYEKHKRKIKLSSIAANILMSHMKIDPKNLKLWHTKRTVIENRRWDPLTASAAVGIGMYADMLSDSKGIVTKPYEEYKRDKASRSELTRPSTSTSSSMRSPPTRTTLSRDGETMNQPSIDQNDAIYKQIFTEPQNQTRSGARTAGAMATASARSLGNLIGRPTKRIFVDAPLAFTEGMHSLQEMCGNEARPRDEITDWKSGAAVAGKTFALGVAEGMVDIFVQTYKGGKKEGALGVVKGFGAGYVGTLTRLSSAGVGLVAYTGQGIYKSIHAAQHAKTKNLIMERRLEYGDYATHNSEVGQYSHEAILRRFSNLKNNIPDEDDGALQGWLRSDSISRGFTRTMDGASRSLKSRGS